MPPPSSPSVLPPMSQTSAIMQNIIETVANEGKSAGNTGTTSSAKSPRGHSTRRKDNVNARPRSASVRARNTLSKGSTYSKSVKKKSSSVTESKSRGACQTHSRSASRQRNESATGSMSIGNSSAGCDSQSGATQNSEGQDCTKM